MTIEEARKIAQEEADAIYRKSGDLLSRSEIEQIALEIQKGGPID